jgi:uncharacterized membrane protein
LQIELLHAPGVFLLQTDAVCRLSRDIGTDKKLRNKVLSCLNFSNEPYGESSYLYGMNQISEVAVKALSPGINDPGTAAIALDYLSNIFCHLLQGKPEPIPQEARAAGGLITKKHSLEELLFLFIHPVGYYGRLDAKVHASLLRFYSRLLAGAPTAEQELIRKLLAEEMQSITHHIQSPLQADLLRKQIKTEKPA